MVTRMTRINSQLSEGKAIYLGTNKRRGLRNPFFSHGIDIDDGMGSIYLEHDALIFTNSTQTLRISFASIHSIKLAIIHRWFISWGQPIIKLLWKNSQGLICSGFTIGQTSSESLKFYFALEKQLCCA